MQNLAAQRLNQYVALYCYWNLFSSYWEKNPTHWSACCLDIWLLCLCFFEFFHAWRCMYTGELQSKCPSSGSIKLSEPKSNTASSEVSPRSHLTSRGRWCSDEKKGSPGARLAPSLLSVLVENPEPVCSSRSSSSSVSQGIIKPESQGHRHEAGRR